MKKKSFFFLLLMIFSLSSIGAQQSAPLQVAVYPFDAIGVEETTAMAITNAVFRVLNQSTRIVVRDQQSTRQALEQIGLAQSGHCADDKCRVEAGKILKAQKLITGSVEKLEENFYTVSMRVVDVETARTEYQVAQDCPCSSLVQVRDFAVELARTTILIYLETGKKPQPQPTPAVSSPPSVTPVPSPNQKEMVYVPAGEFMMGCNEAVDKRCATNEKPYHKVYLDAYYIDKYEVTVAEYTACVKAGKCTLGNSGDFCNYGREDRQNHPINCVDWNQARTYCEWMGKRLPTEAEWEKAARGTDGRVYPWGNIWNPRNANWDDNGREGGYTETTPVGSFAGGVSPYGAYDMSGNVWEWVSDWYDGGYYKISPSSNPRGPESGRFRVLRGGGWLSLNPNYLRASIRIRNVPDDTNGSVGFRCARD